MSNMGVLYGEWQGWISPYSWKFLFIGYILSRASFHKGSCLLLRVLAPGLRSTLTGEDRLALLGLLAAHTMGFTLFLISLAKDVLLPAPHMISWGIPLHALEGPVGGAVVPPEKKWSGQVLAANPFPEEVLDTQEYIRSYELKLSSTAHSNGFKKNWLSGLPEILVTVTVCRQDSEVYWPWNMLLQYQSESLQFASHC